ncbi:hypothetical protein SAMN05421743_11363 [Thalassobacillus cyri]|uniref:Uncharacterized protein n=1 Tax=Thalassobacillus cyri TaxID=571932 RepID=A0A1H4G1H3_9BACI|nr:hypothetical protein [Thalassobacillus cyri]SEB02910.1 hypothetical protein SAMN05421743_11363 [Thalassobacillus cyri]
MAGNLLWNLSFAVFGFCLSLILSLQNNSLDTSMIRAASVFIFMYVLAFSFRWAFHYINRTNHQKVDHNTEKTSKVEKDRNFTREEPVAKQASETIRQLLNED